MPYAQPALEIKLFGTYRRVWDLLVPAFFIVAIGDIVTILVASWFYQQPGVRAFMEAYPGVSARLFAAGAHHPFADVLFFPVFGT